VREMRRTGSNRKREAPRRSEVSVQGVRPPLERGDENEDRQAPRVNVGDLIYNGTLRIVSIHKMEILNKEGGAFGYRIISVEAV
jgi:hypothetical protein